MKEDFSASVVYEKESYLNVRKHTREERERVAREITDYAARGTIILYKKQNKKNERKNYYTLSDGDCLRAT